MKFYTNMLKTLAFVGLFMGSSSFGNSILHAEISEVVDIIFVGGQSNATADWAGGIEQKLKESGRFSNLKVVHSYHPGQWLRNWYSNGPNDSFCIDFYNPTETGVLEKAWKEVQSSGKKPRFVGFFWWQGEGDTGNARETETYAKRFNSILQLLQKHFEIESPLKFAVAIIDADMKSKNAYPLNPKGRTQEMVDGMREVLKKLGQQANGVAVDTCERKRVDMWHVHKKDKEKIGREMAEAFLKKFYSGD